MTSKGGMVGRARSTREGREDHEKVPNSGFFQCVRLSVEDDRGFVEDLGLAFVWT